MIGMHLVYGLNLIALALGSFLWVYSTKNGGKGSVFGKLFGLIVVGLSLISMICIFSCSMRGDCHKMGIGGTSTMVDNENLSMPAVAKKK